ncbi:uncharacterized protein LOC101216494 [Cucumis sativus]|uniref:Uncharacterized protein n=1 Tax=Cucumis sativus TaxID=3659 RepID=A0A0A0KNX0_CUCSA|nr:uncharacterized protein LOC101216494 [Cucumis sativus]XP_011654744.1 uncharacterized protein LOC101216494 [Cucumis sativus]KGN50097.1 hypothetical protein Csa_000526 [Cucumis sativus]
MGQETELDFDSLCAVDLSPNTVLPSIPRRSSIKNRSTRKKLKHEDFVLSVKDDFTEIKFGGGHRSRKSNSSSLIEQEDNESKCFELNVEDDFTEIRIGRDHSSHKSNSPSLVELEDDKGLKRRSKYQSSEDIGKIEGMGIQGERRKIEISREDYTSWSSGIVDSLCSSDEEKPERRDLILSLDTKLNQPSVNKACMGPRSSDSFIEIYSGLENSETVSKDPSNQLGNVTGIRPLHNGKKLFKRDKVHALQKSFSAKVEMPSNHLPVESDLRFGHSPKVHISPFRKILDPFMKSKSVRSRFSHAVEAGRDKAIKAINLERDETSSTPKSSDSDSNFSNNDNLHNVVASSPVHLHGSLKLEKKHGMPFFEFSQSSPEDVYVAKTWKTGNAFKWVYTFHSQDHHKKSNAGSFGLNHSCKNSLMVGQMQVSCYLSSELRDGGFDNSMVTEFVLYDAARARQSTASQGSCDSIHDAVKPPKSSDTGLVGEPFSVNDGTPLEKFKFQRKHASENCDHGSIDSCPWDSADLHPDLESAAIVMQIPFSKRESLKYKRGDKTSGKLNSAIQNLSKIEQRKEEPPHHTTQETLKVVIPTGNHGLPTVESQGPSTLLDRWRLGGGCDCGGWDMGCPLLILGTHSSHCAENQAHKGKQTFHLFHQGAKDTTPALTMNIVKDGQYSVDFHARLSTLQAFSICVAILHATEACNAVQVEETKELQQCNSLKVLLEEEVKFLIDAVAMEEKKRETRMLKETPSSYLFNPPFSPIARV